MSHVNHPNKSDGLLRNATVTFRFLKPSNNGIENKSKLTITTKKHYVFSNGWLTYLYPLKCSWSLYFSIAERENYWRVLSWWMYEQRVLLRTTTAAHVHRRLSVFNKKKRVCTRKTRVIWRRYESILTDGGVYEDWIYLSDVISGVGRGILWFNLYVMRKISLKTSLLFTQEYYLKHGMGKTGVRRVKRYLEWCFKPWFLRPNWTFIKIHEPKPKRIEQFKYFIRPKPNIKNFHKVKNKFCVIVMSYFLSFLDQ